MNPPHARAAMIATRTAPAHTLPTARTPKNNAIDPRERTWNVSIEGRCWHRGSMLAFWRRLEFGDFRAKPRGMFPEERTYFMTYTGQCPTVVGQ